MTTECSDNVSALSRCLLSRLFSTKPAFWNKSPLCPPAQPPSEMHFFVVSPFLKELVGVNFCGLRALCLSESSR